MFADSDDYLPCDALQTVLNIITSKKADIVQASWYTDTNGVIKKNKRLIKSKQFNNESAIEAFLNFRMLGGYIWSKLYRTEVIKNIEFPTDMSLGEDGVFAFRAFLNAKSVAYVSIPIYYYRIRQNSLTMRESVDFCDRNLDVFKQIDYIHKALEEKNQLVKHENSEKVFDFALSLEAYKCLRKSDQETQIRYHDVGCRLKQTCDNLWKIVLASSFNPRVKLQAFEYGIRHSKCPKHKES